MLILITRILFHPPHEKEEPAASASFPWCCALPHLRAVLTPEPAAQGKVTVLGFT